MAEVRLKSGTLNYSLEVCENHQEISITNWFIRDSALGPIGGLSARESNGCLPRRAEKRGMAGLFVRICRQKFTYICYRLLIRHE